MGDLSESQSELLGVLSRTRPGEVLDMGAPEMEDLMSLEDRGLVDVRWVRQLGSRTFSASRATVVNSGNPSNVLRLQSHGRKLRESLQGRERNSLAPGGTLG